MRPHLVVLVIERVDGSRESSACRGCLGSRVDGALGKNFLTFLQHWSGAVTCPAC
jgi:hypothetical protein